MAADGNYYNARKVNIKHLVDPIDELFLAAQTIPGITTTGKCEFVWCSQKQEKHRAGTPTGIEEEQEAGAEWLLSGYSCLLGLDLKTLLLEKNYRFLLKDSHNQKKKKKGILFPSYLSTKKKKKEAQMYYLHTSLCTYTLSAVFDSDFILYFLCWRQHRT